MLIVGLTGGIACGKSTVSEALLKHAIHVIDCDRIAFEAVQQGTWGYKRVVSAFGSGILKADGEVDRVALGQLVFSEPAARQRLNTATHLPVLVELMRQLLTNWICLRRIVVVDMPLLFETGFYKYTGCNVVVACSPQIQLQRLMLRDGSTAEAAQARINSQMPLVHKVQMADYVVNNNADLEQLQQQVNQLVGFLTTRSRSWRSRLLSPLVLLAAGVVAIVLVGTLDSVTR